MNHELITRKTEFDLVSKQVLSQMMKDSMELEFSSTGDEVSFSADLKGMLEKHSVELIYGECFEQLVQSNMFSSLIDEDLRAEREKGRLQYISINKKEPVITLSKRF